MGSPGAGNPTTPTEKDLAFFRFGKDRRIEDEALLHVFGYRGIVPATLCGLSWHSDLDMPGPVRYTSAITCPKCTVEFEPHRPKPNGNERAADTL